MYMFDEKNAGLTVMVVEDHDDTRYMFKWALEESGYRVVEASDGGEAVSVAARERPDLILMDGTLPVFDGLTAARRIREQTALSTIPIVALSGHATPEFRDEALAAGCQYLLIKPITVEALVERVRSILHRDDN